MAQAANVTASDAPAAYSLYFLMQERFQGNGMKIEGVSMKFDENVVNFIEFLLIF